MIRNTTSRLSFGKLRKSSLSLYILCLLLVLSVVLSFNMYNSTKFYKTERKMKKVIVWTILVVSAFLFEGCGGKSQSIYTVKPTPLKKGLSKYYVKDLKVNLTEQGFLPENILGKNKENKSFLDEEHLKEEFTQFLNNRLREKGILGDKNDFGLSILTPRATIMNVFILKAVQYLRLLRIIFLKFPLRDIHDLMKI